MSIVDVKAVSGMNFASCTAVGYAVGGGVEWAALVDSVVVQIVIAVVDGNSTKSLADVVAHAGASATALVLPHPSSSSSRWQRCRIQKKNLPEKWRQAQDAEVY